MTYYFTAAACLHLEPAFSIFRPGWRLDDSFWYAGLGARKMSPTKIRFGTSTPLMKSTVAWMMVLALVSIATICPADACPLGTSSPAQSKSCCHEPKSQQPTSCPRTTTQNCPFLNIEKITPATGTPDALSASFYSVAPQLPVSNPIRSSEIEDRLPDSSGLFLRIRVLLI